MTDIKKLLATGWTQYTDLEGKPTLEWEYPANLSDDDKFDLESLITHDHGNALPNYDKISLKVFRDSVGTEMTPRQINEKINADYAYATPSRDAFGVEIPYDAKAMNKYAEIWLPKASMVSTGSSMSAAAITPEVKGLAQKIRPYHEGKRFIRLQDTADNRYFLADALGVTDDIPVFDKAAAQAKKQAAEEAAAQNAEALKAVINEGVEYYHNNPLTPLLVFNDAGKAGRVLTQLKDKALLPASTELKTEKNAGVYYFVISDLVASQVDPSRHVPFSTAITPDPQSPHRRTYFNDAAKLLEDLGQSHAMSA